MSTPKPKEQLSETTFEDVKKLIKRKILAKYEMTIYEFANSEHVRKKLDMKPATFKSYLSNGSNSYPALKKILLYLELPELQREVKIVKTHRYFLVPEKSVS